MSNKVFENEKIVPTIRLVVGYAAVVYLGWVYVIHGLGAISASPGFVSLVTGMGIPFALAQALVIFVGVIDLLVALALFAFRRKWVVVYAGVWPLVPFVLGYVSTNSWTLNYLLYPVVAAIIYVSFFGLPHSNKVKGGS